jgi:cytochrome c oxidase subunit II
MPSGVRRNALVTVVTTLVALGTASVASSGNGGLLPPSAHSPNGQRINDAYYVVLVFTGVVFVLVEGALIAFMFKYRRGRRARTVEGPQIHGSGRLEVMWTVVPVLILAAIGTFVFYELPGIKDVPSASASDSTTVRVEGHQFYWLFRYPNGAISIDRMVAPADQVVREEITAPDFDVNHSWWVPALGGKFDAIPGTTNETWFKAPAGTYVARCAELCGIQHAFMDGSVEVVPRAQYDSFVAGRKNDSAELGREEWKGVCSKCHRLDKQYIGPPLGGNPLLADRRGIEALIRNGQGEMPAVGKNWSGAQIDALVTYTKTLGGKSGG